MKKIITILISLSILITAAYTNDKLNMLPYLEHPDNGKIFIPNLQNVQNQAEKDFIRFQNSQFTIKQNDPRDEIYDVTFYDISFKINFDNETLDNGKVIMKFFPLQTNITQIDVDLYYNMNPTQVLDENGNPLDFNHNGNIIEVDFDNPLTQNELTQIEIHYNGSPENAGGFQSFTFETHGVWPNQMPCASTLSEPYGAKTWWPCKDNVADKADSVKLHITVRGDFKVASNGMLTEITDELSGEKTFHWEHNYPITTYLVAIAATDYTEFTQDWDYGGTEPMLIQNFVYPENYNDAQDTWLDVPTMLDCFTQQYGMYPFVNEKYGQADFQWGGAMEHQTMTFITGGWGGYSTSTIAHELAHMWYGDMITCSDWHNLFINEGFATYSQAVYFEYTEGNDYYHQYINQYLDYAKSAQYPVYIQNVTDIYVLFDYATTYVKGASILHMLRGILGTEVFFDAMRAYSDDPEFKYKHASIEQFLTHLEDFSGVDLSYFYDQWFTRTDYPEYEVSSFDHGGSLEVLIEQNQSSFYTMPMDIKINFSDGSEEVHRIFNDQEDQTFFFDIEPVKGGVQSVELDPEIWIIRDVSYSSTDIADNDNIFRTYLKGNYPNPFNPETTVSFQIKNGGSNTEIAVYNTKGQLIKTLHNGFLNQGNHSISWNGTTQNGGKAASGIYFLKMKTDDNEFTHKMLLIK